MTNERVTIEVESNIGEDGPLTVVDTLHQLLDAFELLSASAAQEPEGKQIRWRLVSMSKNSPATATGEAYSEDPSIPVAVVLRRAKIRLSDGLRSLENGEVVPWVAERSHRVKEMLQRNLNGVGKTIFDLGDDAPRTVIVERSARTGLRAIQRLEADNAGADKSRSEYGTIDAYVARTDTYYGKPALYVRERLSDRTIACVLSEAAAAKVGPSHSWADAWSGKRVRIKGELFYDASGQIARVNASDVIDVVPEPVDLKRLRQIDILEGADPTEHIDKLWGHADDG